MNWQLSRLILGIESDISYANIKSTGFAMQNGNLLAVRETASWFGTARGRVGITPIDALLIYGTAGFALSGFDTRATIGFPSLVMANGFAGKSLNPGVAYGGGLEYAVTRHGLVRAEYIRLDLGYKNIGFSSAGETGRLKGSHAINQFRPGLLARY